MAAVLPLFPLFVGVFLLALPLFARLSGRLRAALTSTSLLAFGSYVTESNQATRRKEQLIRAAHMSTMYRVYASRTLLYTTVMALGGSLVGLYVIVLGLQILALPAETLESTLPEQMHFLAESLALPELTSVELLVLFVLSSAVFGTLFGVTTYLIRWRQPRWIADDRERRIDESLPRTVAFMFALSRSGMSHEELIEILSRNSKYFGETANEFVISLRDIRVSGVDFLTATRRLAETTPSTDFANFAEDLTTVLRTGRSTSEYFREKYEQYQEDKRTNQEQVLEQLAALAEGYVALLVAGPLFLITILVIIGLLVGGTLDAIRAFVYLILPITSIGFMFYVGSLAASLGIDVEVEDHSIGPQRARTGGMPDESVEAGTLSADGGVIAHRANRERLRMHLRLKSLRRSIAQPVETAISSPDTVLYVVTPVATLYLLARTYLALTAGAFDLRAFDDYLVQSSLFGLGTFATAHYLHSSRQGRIEEALPDFMDRLADQTEAGMTLTRAILDMDASSVPGLQREIKQLQADIGWGGRVSYSLYRLAERTQSVFMSRAVILMTNALKASGDLAPVLRIAADEAQFDRRLRRRRRQELLVYQVIIYVSMLVFVGIIVALQVIFIPSLPSAESLTGSVGGAGGAGAGGVGIGSVGGLGGLGGEVSRDAYSLVLLHSAMIQGVLAGFVAGKMGEGTVRAGAKHATVLLAVAYVVTLLL